MKTFIKILLALIVVAVMVGILWASEVRSQKIMAVDYCFNEDINGELIPYVCDDTK